MCPAKCGVEYILKWRLDDEDEESLYWPVFISLMVSDLCFSRPATQALLLTSWCIAEEVLRYIAYIAVCHVQSHCLVEAKFRRKK